VCSPSIGRSSPLNEQPLEEAFTTAGAAQSRDHISGPVPNLDGAPMVYPDQGVARLDEMPVADACRDDRSSAVGDAAAVGSFGHAVRLQEDWRAQLLEAAQVNLRFNQSIKMALSSAGFSCWVQWPQSAITFFSMSGTQRSMPFAELGGSTTSSSAPT
jgi:hypothetical protein